MPIPAYKYEASDFWIEFRKNIYSEEYLQSLEINGRPIEAILHIKENEKITNSVYQKLNNTSNRTATRDLAELVELGILESSGTKGAGAFYCLK